MSDISDERLAKTIADIEGVASPIGFIHSMNTDDVLAALRELQRRRRETTIDICQQCGGARVDGRIQHASECIVKYGAMEG